MVERVRLRSPLLPPVLITESADEQERILRELEQEFKPVGIIEQGYVAQIAAVDFETRRLCRWKTAMLNSSYRPALEILLARLLREPGQDDDYVPEAAKVLAFAWFTDENSKAQVRQILRGFHLDESAIEAEAYRLCASQLEPIDRQLERLERLRTRRLACLVEYRISLALVLKAGADRIIDEKPVRRLEHRSGKKSAA